jgi:hypothetical protein
MLISVEQIVLKLELMWQRCLLVHDEDAKGIF